MFVSDHLSGCETCRRRVEESMDSEATYFALRSGVFEDTEPLSSAKARAHLTFKQMAGFVDEAVAAEELLVAKDHLAWCKECETAVDDLRAFKDQVTPEFERENRLSPMGVATEGRWRRMVAAMASSWPKSPAPLFGSALAILLLAAAGALGWRALQGSREKPEVVVAVPTSSASPSVLPVSTPEGVSAAVIARLNDGGGQVTLDSEGKLSGADHLPPAYRQMIERALTGQEIERSPLLAGLTQPGSMPRGNGGARSGEFSAIKPVGVVILPDRPTFRWSPLDGATVYVVEVYDERFDLAATSPQVIDTSWTPPQALKRGGIYYWQVKAVKDGREFKSPSRGAPQAKFRVLDEAKANELAQARRAYGSSHLTLGLLYAQAGLLNEAELEFRALLKANPDSPPGRRLLKQVQTKP